MLSTLPVRQGMTVCSRLSGIKRNRVQTVDLISAPSDRHGSGNLPLANGQPFLAFGTSHRPAILHLWKIPCCEYSVIRYLFCPQYKEYRQMTIGEKLKQLRLRAGLSQAELGSRT